MITLLFFIYGTFCEKKTRRALFIFNPTDNYMKSCSFTVAPQLKERDAYADDLIVPINGLREWSRNYTGGSESFFDITIFAVHKNSATSSHFDHEEKKIYQVCNMEGTGIIDDSGTKKPRCCTFDKYRNITENPFTSLCGCENPLLWGPKEKCRERQIESQLFNNIVEHGGTNITKLIDGPKSATDFIITEQSNSEDHTNSAGIFLNNIGEDIDDEDEIEFMTRENGRYLSLSTYRILKEHQITHLYFTGFGKETIQESIKQALIFGFNTTIISDAVNGENIDDKLDWLEKLRKGEMDDSYKISTVESWPYTTTTTAPPTTYNNSFFSYGNNTSYNNDVSDDTSYNSDVSDDTSNNSDVSDESYNDVSDDTSNNNDVSDDDTNNVFGVAGGWGTGRLLQTADDHVKIQSVVELVEESIKKDGTMKELTLHPLPCLRTTQKEMKSTLFLIDVQDGYLSHCHSSSSDNIMIYDSHHIVPNINALIAWSHNRTESFFSEVYFTQSSNATSGEFLTDENYKLSEDLYPPLKEKNHTSEGYLEVESPYIGYVPKEQFTWRGYNTFVVPTSNDLFNTEVQHGDDDIQTIVSRLQEQGITHIFLAGVGLDDRVLKIAKQAEKLGFMVYLLPNLSQTIDSTFRIHEENEELIHYFYQLAEKSRIFTFYNKDLHHYYDGSMTEELKNWMDENGCAINSSSYNILNIFIIILSFI